MAKSRVVIKGHEGKLRIKENVSGTVPDGTQYYAVTAVVTTESGIRIGLTTAATNCDSVVRTATGSNMLNWRPVTNATAYYVYGQRGGSRPALSTTFTNKLLATIPGSKTGFVDDGSYASSTKTAPPGGGWTNVPSVYGFKTASPATQIPATLTECAFTEASIEFDEGYSMHTHAGDRRKTGKEGAIEVKGTITRYLTGGAFAGAVSGSDIRGTTNTTLCYANNISGTGEGSYDGTSYTSANNEQSCIPRIKPNFAIEITDAKNENQPIVYIVDTAHLTSYKTGTSADKEVLETISFEGEGYRTESAYTATFI